MANTKRKLWKIVLITLMMFLFWTFIVCFPNPFIFIRNGVRYLRFPIDPSVVELIETPIPEDPTEIEKFAHALVKYQYDWQNYGMPDYVSTARQAVTRRRGDCEDRALVFASILEAKKLPYDLKASITHFWVDYPGKKSNKSENEDVTFFGKVDGKHKLKLPALSQWRQYMKVARDGLWNAMPSYRKVLMISGWALIIIFGCFLIWSRGRLKAEPGDAGME